MRANTRMNEKIIMNAAIKRTHKMIISVNLDDKPHNFPRRNKKVDCTTKQPLFKGLHENLFQRIDFTQVQKYCSICKFFVFSTYIGDIPYRVLSFMIVSIGFNHWFIKFCTLELQSKNINDTLMSLIDRVVIIFGRLDQQYWQVTPVNRQEGLKG